MEDFGIQQEMVANTRLPYFSTLQIKDNVRLSKPKAASLIQLNS